MLERLQVGAITSTHGIKGEVKVYPTTDDMNRFDYLDSVIMETPKGDKVLEIENVKYFKQFVILKFKGIDNINDVEKYKGMSLFVSRENAVSLEEDEFFVGDIIDSDVIDDKGNKLGTLADVMFTGSNDVYVVKGDDGKEILIPAIKQCILNVDVDKHCIKVKLLEGLVD